MAPRKNYVQLVFNTSKVVLVHHFMHREGSHVLEATSLTRDLDYDFSREHVVRQSVKFSLSYFILLSN